MEAGLKLAGKEFTPKIIWHPFQLNPDMPVAGMNRPTYRTKKFGSWERSLAMDAEVAATGKSLGIEFNYDKVLMTPNTMKKPLKVSDSAYKEFLSLSLTAFLP